MKRFWVIAGLVFSIVSTYSVYGQNETGEKGIYTESKSEFYEQIQKDASDFNKEPKEDSRSFKVDFTGIELPKLLGEFTYAWHNEQVSQGLTGTCWAFAGTSFFESEIFRLHNEKIKLSEMHTVYWEYVEKARYYVEQRGKSNFSQGSEGNAVVRIWKKYGVVPLEVYSGKLPGQKVHDHGKMVKEMSDYLKHVKASNAWNENEVINTIRSILDHYIGCPPADFTINDVKYSPKEYLAKVVKLNLDDYVNLISVMKKPYNTKIEYVTDDNWWHSKDYFNISLTEYMDALKTAVRGGYSACISGDVSEPGIESHAKVAIIPSFDIPSKYINEYAREFRMSNKTTSDDHVIHLVGYAEKNNKDWYLIKDSGAGSKNKEPKGYYFFHEDYVKIKMVEFMVHKDAVKNILEKFNNK